MPELDPGPELEPAPLEASAPLDSPPVPELLAPLPALPDPELSPLLAPPLELAADPSAGPAAVVLGGLSPPQQASEATSVVRRNPKAGRALLMVLPTYAVTKTNRSPARTFARPWPSELQTCDVRVRALRQAVAPKPAPFARQGTPFRAHPDARRAKRVAHRGDRVWPSRSMTVSRSTKGSGLLRGSPEPSGRSAHR